MVACDCVATRVQVAVSGGFSGRTRPGGAWGIPDAKRLWFHPTIKFDDMRVPEAQLDSAAAAAAAAAAETGPSATAASVVAASQSSASMQPSHDHRHELHAGSGLELHLSVKSTSEFDVRVRGLPGHLGAHTASGSGGDGTPCPPSAGDALPVTQQQQQQHVSHDGYHHDHIHVQGARLVADDRLEAQVAHQRWDFRGWFES
jgi:hypothetical protein